MSCHAVAELNSSAWARGFVESMTWSRMFASRSMDWAGYCSSRMSSASATLLTSMRAPMGRELIANDDRGWSCETRLSRRSSLTVSLRPLPVCRRRCSIAFSTSGWRLMVVLTDSNMHLDAPSRVPVVSVVACGRAVIYSHKQILMVLSRHGTQRLASCVPR